MKNLIFCFFTTITIFSQNELTSTINNYLDDNMSRYLFLDSDIDEFTINNEINSVQLIDINGRQVFKGNYNFENISSGIYILKLNNNNIFYNYKLILK